ncbi:MAG TPA: diguanylate cyclase [Thermomonas sp.]|nr:diguanylate cyclase [Thermomonas sp.]
MRIAREALQGDNLDALMRGICECLVAELPVAIASVILLDDAGTHFVNEVYAGEFTLSPLPSEGAWPVSRGCAGRCARTGAVQLIDDVDRDPDYVAGNAEVRSEYLVPIRHRQRMHGVLNLESTQHDFFDAEVCRVFDAVADLVAGAIHFARLADALQVANGKLEQLSMIDGLTGIANRRHFDAELQRQWQQLGKARQPLALLMIDVDAFKALNDACGHLYGDECLRELASLCQRHAEARGLAARFGGEELVLLLPGKGVQAALASAEGLRAAVEQLARPHPASPVGPHLTVSVGVASRIPDPMQAPEQLLAEADRALYVAKAQGRNQVRLLRGA